MKTLCMMSRKCIINGPYLYLRYRTGTSLQLRLLNAGSPQMLKSLFNDIPGMHEPQLQTSFENTNMTY